jgi:FlaA1/EpsC-like NDP-sugar epimerase
MPHRIDNSRSGRLRIALIALPRGVKRGVLLVADFLMIPVCLWAALALKGDSLAVGLMLPVWVYLAATLTSMLVFVRLGLYRAITRFVGFRIMIAVLSGAAASAAVVYIVGMATKSAAISAAICVIYGLNVLFWVTATRLVARWVLSSGSSARLPVVIYGAGEAGAQLAAALASSSHMYPVAFVDEKTALHGSTIGSVRVMPPADLKEVIAEHNVANVLLALPAASRRRRGEIIRQMVDLGVHVQTVPDLNDIISGRATLADLRDISIEDLLGRDPVTAESRLLGVSIRGKRVMVTGAGGSIGSELCRQILREQPSRLVLFELSEFALYDIERELRSIIESKSLKVELVALLGNTQHRGRLREVMQAYGVHTVYHAAAYKHVPIVEQNLIEGIYNNVFATWNAAEAAIEAGIETFVLISTDKAVHPTNVMGATKRFAEIILQSVQQRSTTTRFCMVRFGNVLGSSGSVVPLFNEQIRVGGPVTVTHQEVRRYFMTIPEAASLVLQAGSMGRGGEVFVLDMGQPVKIDELARRMIALSGLTVRDEHNTDGDIGIEYTGLRPGEKLYEELLIGENVSGTEHPMIMRAYEHCPTWAEVQQLLVEMRSALESSDCDRAREVLTKAVREYIPAEEIHDLIWSRHSDVRASGQVTAARYANDATVVPIRAVPPS